MNNQELLECIAPYLPYDVKGVFLFNGKKEGQIVNKSKTLDLRTVAFYIENSDHIYFKPILRPVSDLTKPCLEGGKVPIEELVKMLFEGSNVVKTNNERIECLFEVKGERSTIRFNTLHLGFNLYPSDIFDQFKAMQFMYKHHFDVFGLIVEGYAIDINTI